MAFLQTNASDDRGSLGDYHKIWGSDSSAKCQQCASRGENNPDGPFGQAVVGQVFPPFLVAGLGMVAAGLLLSTVTRWDVFVEAKEMLILVPALLGLKGNLEMTLASRLSTHANLGHMDGGRQLAAISVGNLAAVQCQAVVVGFLASLVAVSLDLLTTGGWKPGHLLLIASSAVAAASIASLVLATLMILIVLVSRRYGINPDNVASPVAGMLGDCCTLALLASIAELLWSIQEECLWAQGGILLVYCLVAPFCAWVAKMSPHTANVLREGWTPVLVSMIISSTGGLILKHSVHRFSELAAFSPVMNGADSNLAAVQASRISTDLHAHGVPGRIPTSPGLRRPSIPTCSQLDEEELLTPPATCRALLGKNAHAATARTLITLAVPGALCFVFLIVSVRSHGRAVPDPTFLALYIAAAVVQVCLLFVAAHGIVSTLWRHGINPDNAAIPYVTSLGDLLGTVCLTGAFWFLHILGGTPWQGAV